MARKFSCTENEIARTPDGMLQGFCLDGVYTFHGIKYADAQRFQQPTAVKPWEGVKEATNYGYICPVSAEPMPTGEVLIPHRFWPSNEHCQYLNIWTPGLDDARRPVLVWLHGGGFANGSSIEQVAYEGDALASWGDAVVITLNHRLNILGYLDMSSFGEKYANSVNAGMADIVEALRWIKRNIAAFGGDPDNVTLFGQSGGGGKISALLQIPEAAGLFHKAILMSGIFEGGGGNDAPVDHREYVLGILEELKIPVEEVERLEKVPYVYLMGAYNKVALKLYREKKTLLNWGPVANDWYLGDPMKVGFSDFAKTVPTMAGSVISEFSMGPGLPEGLSREEKLSAIEKTFGGNTAELVKLFEMAYPDKDIARLLKVDVGARRATTRFIERKSRVSDVPNYLYLFALDFDVNGPRPAWHCSDIPFVFHNTARVPCANIEGVTDKLESQSAWAWVNFARSGDPSNDALGEWPAYTDENPATMVFDKESRVGVNYDRALIERLNEVQPPMGLGAMAIMMLENAANEQGGDWMY